MENLKKIDEHNELYNNGKVRYSLKINHLADRTNEEIHPAQKQKYFPIKASSRHLKNKEKKTFFNVPDSIDWRDYGVITPVEDQLFCQSCWAFAVVSILQSSRKIHIANRSNLKLFVN